MNNCEDGGILIRNNLALRVECQKLNLSHQMDTPKATVKAWMNFEISSSVVGENIANVAIVDVGTYKVFFKNPMSGVRYAVVATSAPRGTVNYNDISSESLVLTVTDWNGKPVDAGVSMVIYES